MILVEPVYLVAGDDGRLRLHVWGHDPDSEQRQLKMVTFETRPNPTELHQFRHVFRKAVSSSLLEVRPRPQFVLGTREDDHDGPTVATDARWRTTYVFIDGDLEQELFEWMSRINRRLAR